MPSGMEGHQTSVSSVGVDQQVDTTCDHETDPIAEEGGSGHTSPVGGQSNPADGSDQVNRLKKINKMKLLVRSHALREAASPPPDSPCPSPSPSSPQLQNNDSSSVAEPFRSQKTPLVITVVGSDDDVSPERETTHVTKNRLRPRVQVESSQCSVDSSSSFVSFSLSRDSSAELTNGSDAFISAGSHSYTDNTGVDLHHFIEETLHRNYKDRMTLLRIEQDMIALVKDAKRTCHRFPAMSSYHRMLVHRVAAFFGMEHNVDQSGNCVVVSKSRHTRLPDVGFKEYVRDDVVLPEEPNRKLNSKRETVSFDEQQVGSGRYGRSPEARSHSLDVVEHDIGLDVHRPRNRALQPQVTWISSTDGIPTLALGARSKENLTDSTYGSATLRPEEIQGFRWTKRFSPGSRHHRVPKVESFDSRDLLSSYGNSLRPTVAKSYSFGGYTPVADAEVATIRPAVNGVPAVYQPHVINPGQNQSYSSRFLSKQDSNSSSISISRSSPTSSGYKSQQSAATSPTPVNRLPPRAVGIVSSASSCASESPNGHQEWTTRASTVSSTATGSDVVTTTPANTTLLWAVTSLDAVPPGSVLINPQTGQPFYNPDGSAYRYDPHLPLPFQVEGNGNASGEPPTGELEQPDAFEGSDHVVVKQDPINEPTPGAPVPIYQNWHQHSYEASPSPGVYPVHPAAYFNPEYSSYQNGATSHHPSGGFYVAGSGLPVNTTSSFDDHMKANCVAVPVAQGNGYVLYQTCLGSGDNGGSIDNELYSAMKNLSLRPLGAIPNVSYPAVLTENLPVPSDMVSTTPFMTAVPIRPMNVVANPKMSASGISLPARSGSTPPVAVACTSASSTASNPYLASVRIPSSGQMMHHQVQPYNAVPNLTPASYHPSMVYPVMNSAPHQQVNRQHYYAPSLVHQLNNSHQFVSSPWLVTAPATNRGTPERDTPIRVDSPVNRMGSTPHSAGRVSCFYGPSFPSPYLNGDGGGGGGGGGMRHSSNALHRQFSLTPSSGPPANMYTLRPRIHQQQQHQLPTGAAIAGSSSQQRPTAYSSVQHQNNQGALLFPSSRHASNRRQVFRPHMSTNVTPLLDSSSIMPLQHCSFSQGHVQHFPSASS